MNETISRSIFKFDEQKEKLQSDYYRLLQEESGLDEKKYILIQWFEEINVFLVCELYINISQSLGKLIVLFLQPKQTGQAVRW